MRKAKPGDYVIKINFKNGDQPGTQKVVVSDDLSEIFKNGLKAALGEPFECFGHQYDPLDTELHDYGLYKIREDGHSDMVTALSFVDGEKGIATEDELLAEQTNRHDRANIRAMFDQIAECGTHVNGFALRGNFADGMRLGNTLLPYRQLHILDSVVDKQTGKVLRKSECKL